MYRQTGRGHEEALLNASRKASIGHLGGLPGRWVDIQIWSQKPEPGLEMWT